MRGLAWIGVLVFAISWFVPVVKGQDLLNAGRDAFTGLGEGLNDGGFKVKSTGSKPDGVAGGPSWLPGWQACRFAWDLLTEKNDMKDDGKDAWKATFLGATCLTNVLMLLAILVLLGPRGGNTLLGLLLLVAAVMNAGWLYLTDGEFRSALSTGYYLWAGSFALVGFAFLRGRDRGALHPA